MFNSNHLSIIFVNDDHMELPSEGVNLFDSVINDIQSIQTRYENMVTSLNLRLRKITNDHQKQMMQIEYHESKIAELQKQSEQYEALVQENVQLKDRCSQQSNEIEELKQTIQNMEADRQAFTKVSHVVAIEKENARLRQELELLNKTSSSSPSADVYEKKIKSTIYYVSNGDDRTIYLKNEDGSKGDAVGTLQKHGDKFKVSWYT